MSDSQCKMFRMPTLRPNFNGKLSISLLDMDSNGKSHILKVGLDEASIVSFRNREILYAYKVLHKYAHSQ